MLNPRRLTIFNLVLNPFATENRNESNSLEMPMMSTDPGNLC